MPAPGDPAPTARQGDVVSAVSPEDLDRALDGALDYRGDVTIVLRDGRKVEGFLFDRTRGPTPAESTARILRSSDGAKERFTCDRIAEVHFSGKDTAAGKTWENWVRRYAEKRLRGEAASIDSEPLA